MNSANKELNWISTTFPFLNSGITRAVFQSLGTWPDRNEALMIVVNGLFTMPGESFRRRAGILSKPTAFPTFNPRSWTRTTSSETSWNLKGGYSRVNKPDCRWEGTQEDRNESTRRVAADAKKVLKALAIHLLSEDKVPLTRMLGEVDFFSPGRIFFIVFQKDRWSPPLSSIIRLL